MAFQKCSNLEALNISLRNNKIIDDKEIIVESNLNEETKLKNMKINLSSFFNTNNHNKSKEINKLAASLQKCIAATCLSLKLAHKKLSKEGRKLVSIGLEKCQNIIDLSINLAQFIKFRFNNFLIIHRYKNQNNAFFFKQILFQIYF
ncbi:hypothetical protein ABPG72_011392 [Tetrahymena utriculariae]